MRLNLKTKQVLGVTIIVGFAVAILGLINLTTLARTSLGESRARNEMLANFIFERAKSVVTSRERAVEQLQTDPGIRMLLDATTAYSKNVSYAAIVDAKNVAIAYSPYPQDFEGKVLEPQPRIDELLGRGALTQLRAILSDGTYEVEYPILMGERESFGAIRVGVSMLLIWDDLKTALSPAAWTALTALLVAVVVSTLLSNWILRPIHVLRRGFARLGMGEEDVKLDLPPGDEFGDLGTSFNTLSAELSAIRAKISGQAPGVESVSDSLEDAVAVVSTDGRVVFANAASRALLADSGVADRRGALPVDHAFRGLVDQVVATGEAAGPVSIDLPGADGGAAQLQSLSAHPLRDGGRGLMGVMLVARNLSYLSQVETTLTYSRKLAALNRLLTGVAHEVKNPLNAMTIHLELLKQKLRGGPAVVRRSTTGEVVGDAVKSDGERSVVNVPAVMQHVSTISMEIRRLDEVVQGFLKFSRPEEMTLQPVSIETLIGEVADAVRLQAEASGIVVVIDAPPILPSINGDPSMLRQAFLNLALNACQAMPNGGTLRFAAHVDDERFVGIEVSDTGVGIAPEHLEKLFDLYFTTKEKGSGLGLSMVYRTIHLHDGTIEVESVPGAGASFRLRLPRAEVPARLSA
jgi:signal transduction histidine kinase/HAMP domain-containing protein